jgi:hypothetical protein
VSLPWPPPAVIAFDFISARIAAAPFIGKEIAILLYTGWQSARLTHRPSTAQRLDLGGVDASPAQPAPEDGAPTVGATTDYKSNNKMR